jgi:hypothetical protein
MLSDLPAEDEIEPAFLKKVALPTKARVTPAPLLLP